ncbi:MAG: D-glycero-beta-D-manno-heptose 1,7-bisphosphate 7-phosphatase [Proteobacteria bacterium]|nr:D-glycero-beta-D-manno-heptose 1,7-bisphosphate 7-phosphatase [Pseudomonadota bacterium]MBU1687749.1 D-glycero-beta-D-manno-heptose 1,7-bisphosphate 7-phosphatase [Pseudomonadota bacterium]
MTEQTKRSAVFLDRDGTINEQMGYINHLSRFQLLPGAAAAIRLLNEHRIPVIVVTNQSGLARGYFSPDLLTRVHEKMESLLAEEGARVDRIYVCPHHPEAREDQYRLACDCRKPKPGLFVQAAAELGIDLEASFVVGDRWSDLKAAAAIKATGILVLTGYGRGDLDYVGKGQQVQPRYIAEDLQAAVQWIIEQSKG